MSDAQWQPLPIPMPDDLPLHMVTSHGYASVPMLKRIHPHDLGEEHRQLHEYVQGQKMAPHTHTAVNTLLPRGGPACCTSFAAMRFCPWCGSHLGDHT